MSELTVHDEALAEAFSADMLRLLLSRDPELVGLMVDVARAAGDEDPGGAVERMIAMLESCPDAASLATQLSMALLGPDVALSGMRGHFAREAGEDVL